jgi:hypothetical protein
MHTLHCIQYYGGRLGIHVSGMVKYKWVCKTLSVGTAYNIKQIMLF